MKSITIQRNECNQKPIQKSHEIHNGTEAIKLKIYRLRADGYTIEHVFITSTIQVKMRTV